MSTEPPAGKPVNHLAGEKSPYLQQHAHQPVDWYPWGEEAFRRAAEEDRPVFLSIGYATCHWCHVMAHESFEDTGIAGILNHRFVAIKVDREERPDIDSVYMEACRQMTGQGGWPLTILMTPDKKPFFAGTYFPRTARAGMPGLSEILIKISGLWKDQRAIMEKSAGDLAAALAEASAEPAGDMADQSLLRAGYESLAASFDPVHGGFGRAPKFPTPVTILFLLRYWKRTGSVPALRMAERTLEALSSGGIHDHLGGGFHRYSTDTQWRIPHFEKMLYDQALLLMAFTEAWQATGKPLYRKTAEAVIAYVTRDLASPDGAFISAEDADSPGGEGNFYLWTRGELAEVLGDEDARFAADLFHVTGKGNFPSPETGPGKNVLYRDPAGNWAGDESRTESVRTRLLARRQERPRPQRDGKVLTDGNGLMIAALALAARAFDEPAYCRSAETAMQCILDRLRVPGGGLLHRYCDGEAAIMAFADDYAFLIRALIGLYETGLDPRWLDEALRLNRYLHLHFSDNENGYFATSDEAEVLFRRRKESYDGAVPSANAMMLQNLVLLGHLTGDPHYEEQASSLAGHFAGLVRCSPSAYCAYLCGLDHLLGPAVDVVIAGEESRDGTRAMIREVRTGYRPALTLQVRTSRSSSRLDILAPFTRSMPVPAGDPVAYVCSGRSCSAPVTTPGELREHLG